MQTTMQSPPDGARVSRVRESVFNHFLLYFVMLAVGFPLSIYLEIIANPNAQRLEYWTETGMQQYQKSGSAMLEFPGHATLLYESSSLAKENPVAEAIQWDVVID